MKVGLKFCGGCRASYDRVELVNSMRKRLAGKIEFVSSDSEEADLILIMSGCPTACAKVNDAALLPIRYITSPEDADKWIADEIGGS